MTHIIFFFKNQNIRLINLEISKTQVHKCTSNHWGWCRTPCTLEMRYGLIPLLGSNIVNPSYIAAPPRENRRRKPRTMGRDPKARQKEKSITSLTGIIQTTNMSPRLKFLKTHDSIYRNYTAITGAT